MEHINSKFIEKAQNYLHDLLPKIHNAVTEIQLMTIFIHLLKQISWKFAREFSLIKEKLMMANYLIHFLGSVVDFLKGE